MAIDDGAKVKVLYTGKLSDGKIFDTNVGKDPFEFEIGGNQVIKGFEEGIRSMQIGDKKTINIPFMEAYGAYLEDLIREYPIEVIQGNAVNAGQTIFMQSNDGRSFPCQVKAVTEDNLTVDFNHPLAGKDLSFELELLAVN